PRRADPVRAGVAGGALARGPARAAVGGGRNATPDLIAGDRPGVGDRPAQRRGDGGMSSAEERVRGLLRDRGVDDRTIDMALESGRIALLALERLTMPDGRRYTPLEVAA